MKKCESPRAGEAAHGASEIDELGSHAVSKRNLVPVLTQARVGAAPRSDLSSNLDGAAKIATEAELVTENPLAEPLRIIIEPTKSGRKWIVRLDNRIVCVSAWPFVKSARRLLAEGHPAEAVFEMWRPGDDAFLAARQAWRGSGNGHGRRESHAVRQERFTRSPNRRDR